VSFISLDFIFRVSNVSSVSSILASSVLLIFYLSCLLLFPMFSYRVFRISISFLFILESFLVTFLSIIFLRGISFFTFLSEFFLTLVCIPPLFTVSLRDPFLLDITYRIFGYFLFLFRITY